VAGLLWLTLVYAISNASPVLASQGLFSFDIPRQSADGALTIFGQQADISVLYQYDLISQFETNALQGEYTVPAALEVLLAGSGLIAQSGNGGHLIISVDNRSESMKKKNTLVTRMAATLATLMSGSASFAEEGTAVVPLEEVVVTAQKREATLRSTPIAITAVTAEMIEKGELYDIRKLEKLAPSLVYNQAPAGVQLYIRGIGQDAPTLGNNPGVAVYVDGVYFGHQFANIASTIDAERFEVVRGPQGTLYGRNSTGGNINVTSTLPDFESFAKIGVSAGSYSASRLSATGNVGLSENVAIRATVVKQKRDGYIKNLTSGDMLDDEDTNAASFALLANLSDDVEFVLRADYQSNDSLPRPLFFSEAAASGLNPLKVGGNSNLLTSRDVYNDKATVGEFRMSGFSGTLTWQLGDMVLKSITARRDSHNYTDSDSDGTDIPMFAIESSINTREISQEFNLLGDALDNRLQWIVGANYYKDDGDTHPYVPIPFYVNLLGAQPPSTTLAGEVVTVPYLDSTYENHLKSWGVFGQGTFEITDDLRATLGYRYTKDEQDVLQTSISNITPPASQCRDLAATGSWNPSTFKLGLDYDVSADVMVYGSASRGFKAGGFNAGVCDDPYNEEWITAYETGLKGRFMDGVLLLNAALYYYDYTDMQVRTFQDLRVEINNAASATNLGGELEFVYLVTGGFRIDGGLNLQNAVYDNARLDDPMVAGYLEADISGKQLLRAPDLKWNLGAQYSYQLDGGAKVDARYEVSYTDSYYTDAHNNHFALIDQHTLQNLRLTWSQAGNGNLWVQGFVENLTDEAYVSYRLPSASLGGSAALWAPPRTYGVRVGYRTR